MLSFGQQEQSTLNFLRIITQQSFIHSLRPRGWGSNEAFGPAVVLVRKRSI